MVPFHVFLFYLNFIFPLVACYTWTPVEPNQPFPLPEVTTPEILPDPEAPSQDVSNTSVGLQNRWVSTLSNEIQAPYAWPLHGTIKPIHRIQFCYADEETQKKASCTFLKALNMWAEALGGEPGKDTGYNLGFFEARFLGRRQYCYKEYNHDEETGKMNWRVSRDTLAVYWKDARKTGGVSRGTIGYTPREFVPNNKGFRHFLIMSGNAPPAAIAHEIGHVLGMLHEMTRTDRDDFIEYRCSKVMDYAPSLDRALALAQKQGGNTDLNYIREMMCTNYQYARAVQFPGYNFAKVVADYDGADGVDFDSIMIYDSSGFANDECLHNLDECPMVKITKENGVRVGVEAIRQGSIPSPRDVAFVRQHYPWKG